MQQICQINGLTSDLFSGSPAVAIMDPARRDGGHRAARRLAAIAFGGGVSLVTATQEASEHLIVDIDDPRTLTTAQLSGNIEEKWR
jgi:uncharacterized membrane protein YgaE (UPF0421/DUF939 family)